MHIAHPDKLPLGYTVTSGLAFSAYLDYQSANIFLLTEIEIIHKGLEVTEYFSWIVSFRGVVLKTINDNIYLSFDYLF